MSDDPGAIPEWPHKPAPPEPKRLLPERELLVRGLALGGLSLALGVAGVRLVWRAGALTLPIALLLEAGSVLAAWASVIHLTGGERFDDHPWV